MNHSFRFDERSWGVNLGILHPGALGGGWRTPAKKKQSTIWLVLTTWLIRAAHDVAYLDRAQHANSVGKLQKQGIDPCASRMLSERSTTYHLGPIFVAKTIRATKGLELVQHPVHVTYQPASNQRTPQPKHRSVAATI